jgi:hypothetical protein
MLVENTSMTDCMSLSSLQNSDKHLPQSPFTNGKMKKGQRKKKIRCKGRKGLIKMRSHTVNHTENEAEEER